MAIRVSKYTLLPKNAYDFDETEGSSNSSSNIYQWIAVLAHPDGAFYSFLMKKYNDAQYCNIDERVS